MPLIRTEYFLMRLKLQSLRQGMYTSTGITQQLRFSFIKRHMTTQSALSAAGSIYNLVYQRAHHQLNTDMRRQKLNITAYYRQIQL